MSNIFSNIKKAFLLTAISFSTLSGLSASAAGAKAADTPAKKHYIVYHDDCQNILRRDLPTADYTFNTENPFFFVTLPVSNTAWCTEYLTIEEIDSGKSYSDNSIMFRNGEKLSDHRITLPLTEDLHLYPVTQYGIYVRFESQGGTPQPYQFLHVGEKAIEPLAADMKKTGYTFGGWYNTAECKDGDNFDFNWSPTREELVAPGAPKEKYAYAKWVPAASSYKIVVWLEKPEHPNRANLTEAKAHMFEDYEYGTFIEKTGNSESIVEFTNQDRNNNAIKTVTFYERDVNTFEVYKYDNKYSSFAQDLSEASINEINDANGISPDGTTVVNVFYRRLVFSLTLGVTNTYYWDSVVPDNPVWDNNYSHFTISVRDGESPGAAINRSKYASDISLYNSATRDLFASDLSAKASKYVAYWSFRFTNRPKTGYMTETDYECGINTLYLNSEIIYTSQYEGSIKPVVDDFNVYLVLAKFDHGDRIFRRIFYYQTIAAAKSKSTGNISNFLSSELIFYRPKTQNTDGFMAWTDPGFTYIGNRQVNRETPVVGNLSPEYGGSYTPDPNRLEFFFTRNSYAVDFVTGTNLVQMEKKSFQVFYEDNLSSVTPKINSGESFIPDVTFYQDSQGTKYFFKGWYDSGAYIGDPVDFSSFSMPARNIQLYAKWEEKQITITFDAQDGTIGPQKQQTLSMVISAGNVPSNPGKAESSDKSGHTGFFCWTKDGVMYDFVEPLFEDTTLEALYYVDPAEPLRITYKSGAGAGDDVMEFADYGYLYNANAGVQGYDYEDYFGDWALPRGKVFKCWEADDTGKTQYDIVSDPNIEIIMKKDVILTAIYEAGKADIVIERNGLHAGESATFTVYRMEENVPVYFLTVIVTGSESETTASRKIVNVEPGTYKVEESKWTWAYDKGDTIVTEWEKTPVTDGKGVGKGAVDYEQTLKFTFTGDPKEGVSQHGENVKYNEFSAPQGDNEIPGGGVNI